MQHKINSLRTRMKDNSVDLIALGPGTHMNWLLGFNPYPDERPCMLLIGKEKETFLMPSVNEEGIKEKTNINMNSWSDADGPDQALQEALSFTGSSNAKHIVIDEFGTHVTDIENGFMIYIRNHCGGSLPESRTILTVDPLNSDSKIIKKNYELRRSEELQQDPEFGESYHENLEDC